MSRIRDRLFRYIVVISVIIIIAYLMSENGLRNLKYRFISDRGMDKEKDISLREIDDSKHTTELEYKEDDTYDDKVGIYDTKDTTNEKTIENETVVSEENYEILRRELNCYNRDFASETKMRGDYWVLQNYAKAGHGPIDCYRYVTFVTHSDFTFIDNLEVLVERWQAPISISLYGPGTDFYTTVQTVRYLKDCSSVKDLINYWVSFHIFFHRRHIPYTIRFLDEFPGPFDCSKGKPHHQVKNHTIYKTNKKLVYPINVGRNIGRDAALTHYFLSLDIELYPIPKLGARFLNMLARNTSYITGDRPRVYVLKPFEVKANETVPDDKTTLQKMLSQETAIRYHEYVCPDCHRTPFEREWLEENETQYTDVTGVGKRQGYWEPLFISSHSLPYLDERLSWDGMRDKMTQAYIMCIVDYDFLILSNAFIVHRPGIKVYKESVEGRVAHVRVQQLYIDRVIFREIKKIYGKRSGCVLN